MPRGAREPLPQPLFDEPVFAQGRPTPDPTRFKVPHPSDVALYRRIQALLYQDVVPVPVSRGSPGADYALGDALGPHGPEVLEQIQANGRIVFHSVGDIGASTQGKYPGEIRVSDRLTQDCQLAPPEDRPAFLFLLGDLIYDFGEARYYYDQFYEPYRDYPAPIFAIPGNHDSFIVPGTPADAAPLATFRRNFCATEPVVTPEAGSLHRTAMTQPGVYFALEAPYVRILGLFSNALEDPGVISGESGKWTTISDVQLDFLTAQLTRVREENYAGCVLICVHHPPFAYAPPVGARGGGGTHASSPEMLADIDRICAAQGVYPHAVLSGHAHNYQRFTRSIDFQGRAITVPFIVCGGGGHDVDPLVRARSGSAGREPDDGADVRYLDPDPQVPVTGLVLDHHDDRTYGYLRVTVDPRSVGFAFHPVGVGPEPAVPIDQVVVDLASHSVTGLRPATHGRSAQRGRSPRSSTRPSPLRPVRRS
jgi:hypothetical protein